ncbi:MAG: cell division protein SepF [Actinomycetota bacterium]|nr:cell division protein SepF [Actinomycetota bacterium]
MRTNPADRHFPKEEITEASVGLPQTKISVIAPSTFDEAQALADRFKGEQPVILNLQNADEELCRRMVDFCTALTYALDGQIQTVANQVFLLTPRNVEAPTEERKQLAELAYEKAPSRIEAKTSEERGEQRGEKQERLGWKPLHFAVESGDGTQEFFNRTKLDATFVEPLANAMELPTEEHERMLDEIESELRERQIETITDVDLMNLVMGHATRVLERVFSSDPALVSRLHAQRDRLFDEFHWLEQRHTEKERRD